MEMRKILQKKLDNLIGQCCSGIVALCGDPGIENGLDYVVYFQSLRIIHVVHTDMCSECFYAGATHSVTRVLEEFSVRDDMLDIVDLGMDETAFLAEDLASLLWEMAHDDDFAYSDEEFEWLANAGLEDPYPLSIVPEFLTFTIFEETDLESDIKHFYNLLMSSEHFSLVGNEFCLGSYVDDESDVTVFMLYRSFVETFTDEETGESVPITRETPILGDGEWRTLYAKMRIFVFLNYVCGVDRKDS